MSDAPKLLEREAEVAALAAVVDRATQRSDRVTAVVAPAGLGKTRLMSEAANLASAAGFDVLYARGTELEQDFAFGLVRQLYEPTLVRMAPAERDVLLDGAASNAKVAVLSNPTDDEARRDFSILHGLYWLTADLAERNPIALILDDLHWADTASLRFLAYLQPRLEGLAVPVFVALRPDVVSRGERLVNQVLTAAETTVLRPAPLSARASGQLVRSLLSSDAEPGFLDACHEATSGNPLLLRDLAVMVKAEGLDPTVGNASMVSVLGPRAVEQRVTLWMDRLSTQCLALARAVAVLGDDSLIDRAAALAELSLADAFRAARDLERADLFRATADTGSVDVARRLQFSHPLVRVAVYGGIDPADRVAAHRRAVDLLQRWHGTPEQVAPHLLRVPPTGDKDVVAILRRAADEAFAHGSPDTAATHLRRCLAEPPTTEQAAQVQWELARIMTLVDTNGAAQDLAVALRLATDPVWRAEIAVLLSTALIFLLRCEEAEQVCRDALAELPESELDLRGKIEAGLLLIPLLQPNRPELADRRHTANTLTEHDTVGGRTLDCMLATHSGWRTDPRSVQLALRGLHAGVDTVLYPESAATPCAWLVLIYADRDEALESIDRSMTQARQHGSVHGLATTFTVRGLAWLLRGQLAEAETDIRAGLHHADVDRFELGHLMAHSFLADVLMERGQFQQAEAELDAMRVPTPTPEEGPLLWYLDSRTRLLRRQGRFAEALDMAQALGRRFQAHGGDNPAFLAWRSEAALSAQQLGRTELAHAMAEADLRLATRWRAPRALGRALRVTAMLRGGASGIRMLHRAIEVLEPSPARLEHATALLELGTLLRKDGQRGSARRHLAQACDLATTCGADPLRDRANAELRAAGGRPKYDAPLGANSLTPSERRVVELAATGRTNRDIAQQLFVTVKTVEVHLTNSYRKLGVGQRDELAGALA